MLCVNVCEWRLKYDVGKCVWCIWYSVCEWATLLETTNFTNRIDFEILKPDLLLLSEAFEPGLDRICGCWTGGSILDVEAKKTRQKN